MKTKEVEINDNIPFLINDGKMILSPRDLLVDFCSSIECYQINTNQVELICGVDMYLKSITINKVTQ